MTEPSKAAFAKAGELYQRELRENPHYRAIELYLCALARVLDEHSDVAKRVLDRDIIATRLPSKESMAGMESVQTMLETLILPDEPDRVTRLADELFLGLAHGDDSHRRWLREEMEKCLRAALTKHGGHIVWDEDHG